MSSKIPSPKPIIDNLKYIENPFYTSNFSVPEEGFDGDLEYALKFLYSYNGSTATFNSYRREIERLLQWAWNIKKSSILRLKREDIEEFLQFCIKPPQSWIGNKNVARFTNKQGLRVPNSEWRPFAVSAGKNQLNQKVKSKSDLSQAKIKAIFTTLSSFYSYLIQENLTDGNPILLIRQKSKFIQKVQSKAAIRRISNLQWDYVIETAEILAEQNPEYERLLFIMNCLLAMYLRISELVSDERSTPLMSHFRKDRDGNWWFHVVGKGNKSRVITVSDEMLNALIRYRLAMGLSRLPTIDEQEPLISKLKGNGSITSTRQIRLIVQECFDKSYYRMSKAGLEEDAQELKAATVHWLRHTGISEDVKIRPREHVRDDAGHSSMATTDQYVDSDLRERHASGKKKRLKDL